MSKEEFINPTPGYRGVPSVEAIKFNDNLQHFANRVSIIVSLEANGKLTQEEAYYRIKNLWKELKASKKTLLEQPHEPNPI